MYTSEQYIKMCDFIIDIPLFGGRFALTRDGEVIRKPYYYSYRRKINGKVTELSRFKNQKILKPVRSGGYIYYTLCDGYERRYIGLHRLMLMSFTPLVNPDKFYVNHKNGIKDDNRLDNLEWVTPKGNSRHAQKNPICSGKVHFSYAEIIKRMYATGKLTQYEIAEIFGINQSTINGIIKGKYYGY